jgi:hypothetical protein
VNKRKKERKRGRPCFLSISSLSLSLLSLSLSLFLFLLLSWCSLFEVKLLEASYLKPVEGTTTDTYVVLTWGKEGLNED